MANGYITRGDAFDAALIDAGIGTAEQLAERAGLARGTAQRVMRGDLVRFETMASVCRAVATSGSVAAQRQSELFERVTE